MESLVLLPCTTTFREVAHKPGSRFLVGACDCVRSVRLSQHEFSSYSILMAQRSVVRVAMIARVCLNLCTACLMVFVGFETSSGCID